MQATFAQLIAGLKSKNEETRMKAANDLHHFVSTELREMPTDVVSNFVEEITLNVFEMVTNGDINEKKGGILAIGNQVLSIS